MANINPGVFNRALLEIQIALNKRLEKVEETIENSLTKIVAGAKRDVPKDTLKLENNIYWEKTGQFKYNLVGGTHYAAYVEFGTRGGGLAESLQKDYYATIGRKFIGSVPGYTPPQPYFFPNINKELPVLYKNIKKVLGSK